MKTASWTISDCSLWTSFARSLWTIKDQSGESDRKITGLNNHGHARGDTLGSSNRTGEKLVSSSGSIIDAKVRNSSPVRTSFLELNFGRVFLRISSIRRPRNGLASIVGRRNFVAISRFTGIGREKSEVSGRSLKRGTSYKGFDKIFFAVIAEVRNS